MPHTPSGLLLLVLSTVVAASCGGADSFTSASSSSTQQALTSTGPRNTSGGCDAEYTSCTNLSIDGMDIGGGGGNGAGEVSCGPNGEMWLPGTGCHPDSRCFQDLDNYENAIRIQWALLECAQRGGTGGTFTSPTTGQPAGVACEVNGVDDSVSYPTTDECIALVRPKVETRNGDGLISEPTRTDDGTAPKEEEPPAEDEPVDADEALKERIADRIDP